MLPMELIFYASALTIAYIYLGYPILLIVISIWRHRLVNKGDFLPKISIIIPVFNEEDQIGTKIDNCLAFDYPKEKFEIVVASDASTDQTNDIVRSYQGTGVKLAHLKIRGGKVSAQNHAMLNIDFDSEVIVFTDVAITCEGDALRLIAENFYDPTIGVVSCRDMIVGTSSQGVGERGYIGYDMMVRRFTSKVGSMIGVTGGFYAIKADIARGGWNPAFPPDFYAALRTLKHGLRVVEDDRVKAYYKTAAKAWDELPRKVRTINRGMSALFAESNRSMMNPFKHGMISIQLISHKLMRWLSPFLFLSVLVTNVALLNESLIFFILFLGQCSVYTMALATLFEYVPKRFHKPFHFAYFFLMANAALMRAWLEFLMGKRYAKWQPTKR